MTDTPLSPDRWRNQMTTCLDKFQEFIAPLGETRKFLINYLSKVASDISYEHRPKGKSLWKFYFDDGVFKGGYTITFRQDELRPALVLLQLSEIPWPGLRKLRDQMDEAALLILKNKYEKYI